MRIEYIKSHLDLQELKSDDGVLEHLHKVLPLDYRALDVAVEYGKYYQAKAQRYADEVNELGERLDKYEGQ